MPDYTVLKQDQIDDMIVNTVKAQEQSLASYQLNIDRYEAMLLQEDLDPEFRTRIEELLVSERREFNRTNAILAATKLQLPTQAKVEASIARLEAIETRTI